MGGLRVLVSCILVSRSIVSGGGGKFDVGSDGSLIDGAHWIWYFEWLV